MKSVRTLLSLAVILSVLYFGFLVLWPRTYSVPRHGASTVFNHWRLSTGSDIAYVFLAGNSQSKKKSTIIYLHGGPGAGITSREIETWKLISAKGFDVYLYDQVGCGRSGRLTNIEEYTVDRHIEDLKEFIDKTGQSKVILAGQSWGSILAVSFLASCPDKVDKLVITAPAPLQPANKQMEKIKPPDSLQLKSPSFNYPENNKRKQTLRMKVNNFLVKKAGYRIVGDEEADNFASWQTNELNRWMVCDSSNGVDAESTEGYYVNMMTSKSIARMKDERAKLSARDVPVLVMKAQCDNQPWGYTAEYLQVFRNAKFVLIKNAGHNAFIEQPGTYVEEISKWAAQSGNR